MHIGRSLAFAGAIALGMSLPAYGLDLGDTVRSVTDSARDTVGSVTGGSSGSLSGGTSGSSLSSLSGHGSDMGSKPKDPKYAGKRSPKVVKILSGNFSGNEINILNDVDILSNNKILSDNKVIAIFGDVNVLKIVKKGDKYYIPHKGKWYECRFHKEPKKHYVKKPPKQPYVGQVAGGGGSGITSCSDWIDRNGFSYAGAKKHCTDRQINAMLQ